MSHRSARAFLGTLPALMLVAAPIFAQSADEVFERLLAVNESTESWTADMTMRMNANGMQMDYRGTTSVKGDRNLQTMRVTMMGQQVALRTVTGSDGIAWTETVMPGMVQVMKLDTKILVELGAGMSGLPSAGMGGGDPLAMLEGYRDLYDFSLKGTETVGGVEAHVLVGRLKESLQDGVDPTGMLAQMGVDMDESRLAVGVDDGFLRRLETGGADGPAFMTIEYSNVDLDAGLDDSLFDYTPPQGAMVMDMTDMLRAQVDAAAAGGADPPQGLYQAGDAAPDFEAALFDGTTIKLSDYRGDVVLLDFWATWCGPCMHELPNVIETYETYRGDGFHVLGISLDDEESALQAFFEDHPRADWPQIFEGRGWESSLAELYGVQAIPYTLLLDRDGSVFAAGLRCDALDAAVAELLGRN